MQIQAVKKKQCKPKPDSATLDIWNEARQNMKPHTKKNKPVKEKVTQNGPSLFFQQTGCTGELRLGEVRYSSRVHGYYHPKTSSSKYTFYPELPSTFWNLNFSLVWRLVWTLPKAVQYDRCTRNAEEVSKSGNHNPQMRFYTDICNNYNFNPKRHP